MTTRAVGNRRLLKLASILDTADKLHRQKQEPTYDQCMFIHDCGTPACALGHWAANNRRTWTFAGHTPRLKDTVYSPFISFIQGDIMEEFDVSLDEADELFSAKGCGNATTAKQAAKYIRKFVAQRQEAV